MSSDNTTTEHAPTRAPFDGAPRRVLLVGWDAADWQMIHPLIEQGHMPTLAGMMRRGVWGNLASMQPMLSPMLWNSIATGKRPDQHRILGFTEPDPDGGGVRTVASTSRQCKAIWNILSQADLTSNVVGWYASHPSEPIRGTMVSNQFEQLIVKDNTLAPPAKGTIHPSSLTDDLTPFRVLPSEIDASAILPFIPNAAELVKQDEHRVGKLQHLLAQTATIHATATHLLTSTEWDFAAVYYEGIDRFGHEFMEFHPPKMDGVSQEDFDAYRHCMVGAYRFHDMMLETLLAIAGDDTAVVLISDHGYYNDHLRPDPRTEDLFPAVWHRPFGVFAAQGPGFTPSSRLYGAGLLDVAPTLLHLLGLPAGHDMPGRVLSEVLTQGEPIDRVLSWDAIEGEAGMHPADLRIDPAESREALKQLVALGYIDPPSEDDEQAARDAHGWNTVNLAHSLVDAGRLADALAAINTLEPPFDSVLSVRLLRATCLLGDEDHDDARDTLESILRDHPDHPRAHMMLGVIALRENKHDDALAHLNEVVRIAPQSAGLHSQLGSVFRALGRLDDSVRAYDTALSIDGDSPVAYLGRARANLDRGDAEAALDDALFATELVHQMPAGHYTIGLALVALGRFDDAETALRLCIAQAPQMRGAYTALADVCRKLGRDREAEELALRGKGAVS